MNGKKLRCVWHSKELFLGITGFNYVVSKQSGSFLNIDTVPKNLTAGKFACIFDKLSELTDSANCAHFLLLVRLFILRHSKSKSFQLRLVLLPGLF